MSIDLETIRSASGSYYFPYEIGNGGALTLFGGYSELDVEDVVEGIDLDGEV